MIIARRMTRNPVTATPDMSVGEASDLMRREKVHRLPVLDKNKNLVGVITEKDVLYASPSPATSLSIHEMAYLLSKLKVKDLWPLLKDSVSGTAVVMLIVGTASLFSYALTLTGIAADASAALISFVGDSKFLFLLIVNIILLIAGCFIDANSAMYIIVPILLPVARALGIDLVHLGCVMVFNLAVGLVTPPVGVNLYVGCGIAGIKLKEICKGVMPLIVASILALLLVTYIEPIAMIVPNLVSGNLVS